MQHLFDHARLFQDQVARQRDHFDPLAAGRSPQVLFLTCSDSRVIPSLITGARPGELFELRTAGNIVPRHDRDHAAGESATIEYAVEVLGVSDRVRTRVRQVNHRCTKAALRPVRSRISKPISTS